MTLVYHVDVEDTNGNTLAVIKNPISFSCSIRIAKKGDYQLVLSGYDDVVNQFGDDHILRFWRKDTDAIMPNGQASDFVNIFNGIHKTYNKSFTGGNKTFTSYGPDSIELLDKSYILYAPNSSQANKSTLASNAMIQFVRENIGVLALTSNGRKVDGTNPITSGGSSGLGPLWSNNVANKNLLTVLQNIRDYSREQNDRVEFNVEYNGNYTWTFYCGDLYTDRTSRGIDPTTGLNAAGNVPIVFASQYNNVLNFFESRSRYNEANVILSVGSGIGTLQQTSVSKDIASLSVSPIAQRETVSNSPNSSNAQLTSVADSALFELKSRPNINFEPKLLDFRLWNDFFPGDYLTAITETNEVFHLQLVETTINVAQTAGGRTVEQLNLTFEEIE